MLNALSPIEHRALRQDKSTALRLHFKNALLLIQLESQHTLERHR